MMESGNLKFERWARGAEAELLLCPVCGCRETHVDVVKVAARRAEDSEFDEITVDAKGRVATHGTAPAPAGPTVNEGRRHRMALLGSCETQGCKFAIVFTQHKGATLVEVVEMPDDAVEPRNVVKEGPGTR